MAKKCKISACGCIYHACMSDDCQKEIMIEQAGSFGPAECENIPAAEILPDCLHNQYCDMQTTDLHCMSNIGCNFQQKNDK